VTPQGLALKTRLTSQYLEASLRVYRELRQAARDTLAEVKASGHEAVYLEGEDEAAEIFRLTCLEQAVKVISASADGVPMVCVQGAGFVVSWPEGQALNAYSE